MPGASGPAAWRLCTPSARAGAIAMVQVRGDVDGAMTKLGIAPVVEGSIGLRMLAGVDRGLVARVRPDLAFLMPHGGVEVVRGLCRALGGAGLVRETDSSAEGAFPEAASPFEARLLATLARAASPRAVDLLLDQARRWAEWGNPEPGEDAPAPDAEHSRLLDRLVEPPLVVAVGGPNIGKSTLLNRLAGRTVAAVADEPGTTRDHLGALVGVDGLVVRYVDTPGMRPDAPAVERAAWEIASGLVGAADLVLLLGDRESPAPAGPEGAACLRVALRSDMGAAGWAFDAEVSALTGEGIGALTVLLRRTLTPDWAILREIPWRFWQEPRPTIAAGRTDPVA